MCNSCKASVALRGAPGAPACVSLNHPGPDQMDHVTGVVIFPWVVLSKNMAIYIIYLYK